MNGKPKKGAAAAGGNIEKEWGGEVGFGAFFRARTRWGRGAGIVMGDLIDLHAKK